MSRPHFACLLLAISFLFAAMAEHAEAARMQVQREGNLTAILIEGELQLGDDKTFVGLAVPLGDAIVILHSPGGSLVAGLEIGKAIRLKGFSTAVPDGASCASACALAWLGGTTRFMGGAAKVGFHAAFAEASGQRAVTSVGNALVGAYVAQLGLPERAVVFITSPQPDGMAWLSATDAQKTGIAVNILSASKPSAGNPQPVPNGGSSQSSRLTKILLGPHIGDATIVSLTGVDSDKAVAVFRRERDDIEEDCSRNLGERVSEVPRCVEKGLRDWAGKLWTRRAWCSRSTIYTEFGNFSMVNVQPEGPSGNGSKRLARTDWKNHRTERLAGNCSACNTPQMIDTFAKLCPSWADRLFSGLEPY